MKTTGNEKYFATKDENGTTILCPIDADAGRDFDECVEEDVVRRYSGNIDADTVFLKGA